MESNRRMPTFICIGAMKCGTTSLHEYLDEHPNVCMSSPKETDFFLERNDKDLSWYENCFESEANVYGEVCTNYSKYPTFSGVVEKMYNLLPDIKLLYVVRDPIERAISHYVHKWASRTEHGSIDDAFLPVDESWYLTVSRYYMQISRYLKYYDRDNIRIIESERLRTERGDVLGEIFDFIGVDADVDSSRFDEEYHRSAEKQRPMRAAASLSNSRIGRTLKKIEKRVVPGFLRRQARRLLSERVEKPKPSEAVLDEARAYLQDDIDNLRRLTGKRYESWCV